MIVIIHKKYIFALLISLFSVFNTNAQTKDQHTKVMLRAIGNEFLLQLGDSTSRILPIEQKGERYELKFDIFYSFSPDLLFFSVFKTFEQYNINERYIVEVEDCNSKDLVHSFEASLKTMDVNLACKKRSQPEGCYVIYFTLVKEETTEKIIEEVSFISTSYRILILAVLLGLSLFFYFKRKKKKQNLSLDLINIGNYLFDTKQMTLSINKESEDLSSMESNLLLLLHSNENNTLKREYILKEIWGDEGNYIGRTLDVFISKLRKKLSKDENIKIINVRGVGYKMVIT